MSMCACVCVHAVLCCVHLYMVVMVMCSIYRSVFTDIMDYIHPIDELILSKENVQVDDVILLWFNYK